MKPSSLHEISLEVVKADIDRKTIFRILASMLNYSSTDAFYASLEEIAADLFQSYPDVPQKLGLGATSYFTRRLSIDNCNALSETLPPLTIPIHALKISHFRLPPPGLSEVCPVCLW